MGLTAFAKAVVLRVLRTSFRVIQPRRAIATPYFKRLRIALGQRVQGMPKDAPEPAPAPDAEIVAIAATAPANLLVIVGLGGLLIILWLMVLKPF